MELKLIMYSESDRDVALTGIMQLTANSPHVGCFISIPFTLKSNVFVVPQKWDRVLMDIVIGVQLYRMRMGTNVTLDISVFIEGSEALMQKKEMQMLIEKEERNGSVICFVDRSAKSSLNVMALYTAIHNQIYQ